MYNTQEKVALDRVRYLLEEYSYTYLAERNDAFRQVVERLYGDVSKELALR